MAYNIDSIVPISYTINSAGLGAANFASAVLFSPESELPTGFDPNEYRTYSSLSELLSDFGSGTETYSAAEKWFGGIPAVSSLTVYGVSASDATPADTLAAARESLWWFWSFFTKSVYASESDVLDIAAWCEAERSFFINCQTGSAATEIRGAGASSSIAAQLTTLGYRFVLTVSHLSDPYAGIAVAKWFANINFSGVNTTITAEYKKLSGVAAEDLTTSEYSAMQNDAVRSAFYTIVDNQGSTDIGRLLNTKTHSAYGEWMDDVVNLEALLNEIRVARYNRIASENSKLGLDPQGQAAVDAAARAVCERYIQNGFLGPREYTDPDDGVEKYTVGYEILSKPEDILSASDEQRAARQANPLRLRVFRRGAIHIADVTLEVI